MPVIDSYIINQFDSYFDNLTIFFFIYTDHFHQDKFAVLNRPTSFFTFTDHFHQDKSTIFNKFKRFQSSTQS